MKENNNDEGEINNNDNDTETLLLKQPLLLNKTNSFHSSNLNNEKIYVDGYDIYCDSKYKIKEIITLKISPTKKCLFIILNIITLGIINLIINYYPHLKLYLLYNKVEIDKSSYIGIYCEDGFFYIVELKKNILPGIEKIPLKTNVISNIPNANKIYTFIFKCFKYIYNEEKNCFSNVCFTLNGTEGEIIKNFWNGLSPNETSYQNIIYGKNGINLETYNFLKLLINEIKYPFNIYIIISIMIWIINNYLIYSFIFLILFAYLLIENVLEKKKDLQNLKNFSKLSGNVTVYQRDIFNDNVIKIIKNVNDLVPGDIYEIQNIENNIIPCDSILINGNIIINESIISGESGFIFKSPLSPTSSNNFDIQKNTNNILYSGTKIIQSYIPEHLNKDNNNIPKALVIGTSFMTKKGNVIREIIYQNKNINKFNEDKNKYIIILFIYSFFYILISLIFLLKTNKTKKEILKFLLDLITIIVPPILPICLNFGIKSSIRRLKKKNIKCVNKDKVNFAGTVDTICFEPSGILSENNIEYFGIQPVILFNEEKIIFDKIYTNLDDNIIRGYNHYKNKIKNNNIDNNDNNNENLLNFNEDYNQLFIECMACCNSLSFDKTNNNLIGNLLDLKMFEETKWKYTNYDGGLIQLYLRPPQENELKLKVNNLLINEEEEDSNFKNHYEIGIVKHFENLPKYQRMSVIVKNLNEKNYKLFVKGSPEVIKELCKSNSLPENYDQIINNNIKVGNQVIALAYSYKNLNFKNIDNIDRDQFETNLKFLGFIIIKNKIKENSSFVIQKLKKQKYKIFLSTYKDTFTAINISKQCQIIRPEDIVFTIELNENNNLKFVHVENYSDTEKFEMIEKFYEIESDMKKEILNEYYLDEIFEFEDEQTLQENVDNFKNKIIYDDYYLNVEFKEKESNYINPSINKHIMIIDGSTFEKIYLFRNKYLSTKDKNYLIYYNAFNLIINKCRLFSGMNLWNKMILLQHLKEIGNNVCICSNNISDCGALIYSDIGLSFLSEKKLIALSFVNEENDINSLVNLLAEGKASTVAYIQIFKVIIIYSFIQSSSVIILLYSGKYLTNRQFLISDLFIIIPICFFISCTDTNKKLSYHKLTGRLVNFSIYLSLLIEGIIIFFFQILTIFILYRQKWYYTNNNELFPGYDNSVIFLMSNFQYLISVIFFSVTYPFRKSIFTNYLLILYLIVGFSYYAYIIVDPDDYSLSYLNLNYFPSYFFRTIILSICILNLICSYLFESYLLPFIMFNYNNNKSNINN